MYNFVLLAIFFAMIGCTNNSMETTSVLEAKVNTVSIARYFKVTTCYTGQKCIGPVVRGLENSNIELRMEPYSKGYDNGYTALDKHKIVENEMLFRSMIRFTKKEKEEGYYIYMMLRSGPTLKRHGKVKTFSIKDLSQLSETKIIDKPIKFKGGTLQAELVLAPPLNLSK